MNEMLMVRKMTSSDILFIKNDVIIECECTLNVSVHYVYALVLTVDVLGW